MTLVKMNDNENAKWFEVLEDKGKTLTVRQEGTNGQPFEINVNMVIERKEDDGTES